MTTELDNKNPVVVQLNARWTQGPSSMEVVISFTAPTLEDALRMIKKASPNGAPLFSNPDHPEEDF